MEWLKSMTLSSSGPSAMPVQQPVTSDDNQRHIQQMLLSMHNMPQAGSRWASPPVGTGGHMPPMPRAAAAAAPMHPGIQHVNHVGAPSTDSATDHSVCFPVLLSL